MKKTLFFICYVIGILIGVMLLIFNSEAMSRDQTMLRYVMMGAGIIFIIPGIVQLIASLKPKKDENGNILPHKWYATIIAVVALLWGIYILIFPLGFNDNLSITVGVSLMIAGLAQAVWIVRTSESTFLRFIVPVVTIAIGVLVCTVFNHYPDNGKSAQIGAIISGIMLMVWGVNGFFSLRSKRVMAAADKAAKIERKAEKEERKAEKQEQKTEKEGSPAEKTIVNPEKAAPVSKKEDDKSADKTGNQSSEATKTKK